MVILKSEKDFSLSIILPTLNESKNINFLVPKIFKEISDLKIKNYEFIVVDDNSTDDIEETIRKLILNGININLIIRDQKKSLPKSIWEGIKNSNFNYVMWLDADGSMSSSSVKMLIENQLKYPEKIFVGSRFVEGGGYKGTKLNQKSNLFNIYKNLKDSEDSFLAMVLSFIFNLTLSKLSKSNIKDMTSGFIIGKKNYFGSNSFLISNYGEYFVYLIKELKKNKIEIIEVGYICELRIYGLSKTGSSMYNLFKIGLPYIKAAYKRRE